MTCCGELIETTDADDAMPVYLCRECCKQGPASAFPDPPTEQPQFGFIDRIRERIADWLYWLAELVAPQ